MVVLLAIIPALVALTIAPGYFFYFDITPKIVLLLAGTGIALFFVRQPKGRALPVFAGLLVLDAISLAVSTAFSTHPEFSLFGANWRRFGSVIQIAILVFAWLVAVVCAGRRDRIRIVLRGIVAAGAVSGAYGIAQYFGWDPFLPGASYHVGGDSTIIVRPPGTLGYASYFATWLLAVVFLGPALAQMEESKPWRILGFAAAPVAALAMLLTGTRAAIVGLGAGGLMLLWRRLSGLRGPESSRRAASTARGAAGTNARATLRIAAAFAVAVLAGAGFYYSPAGLQMRNRGRWFVEDPWGGARTGLWRDSLSMAAHRPLLGFGPDVFTAEFPRYESVALARAYPEFAHESPHNIFLDALVAQGIPGVLILLGFCAIPFFQTRRVAVSAALVAAVVSQQFTAFTMPTALLFFTLLALLVAFDAPPVEAARRLPVSLLAAAAGCFLLFFALRFTLADHALASAKQAVDEGNLNSAAAEFDAYQRWRLPGGTADLWYSRAVLALATKSSNPMERFSAVAQSGAAAMRATTSAEDPFNAWYNLAVLYGLQNDAANSERSLRAAIAAHPHWFKPHWTLAQILRLQGRMDEARREADLAATLDGGKDPEVARTAQEIGSPFQK